MGIVFVVIIAGLAVWAWNQSREATAGSLKSVQTGQDTPLEILKKRYARGEIDRTEFETRRQDLV